jgi:hypothetical protein
MSTPTIYGEVDYGEVLYGATPDLPQPPPPQPVLAPPAPGQVTQATPIRIQTGTQAQWVAEPFIAQSLNYSSVAVSWTEPLAATLE